MSDVSNEPMSVEPFPVITQIVVSNGRIQEGEAPPREVVMVQTKTPTGSHVVFLPTDFARGIAAQLMSHADQADARGIVVADPTALRHLRGVNGSENA